MAMRDALDASTLFGSQDQSYDGHYGAYLERLIWVQSPGLFQPQSPALGRLRRVRAKLRLLDPPAPP